MDATSQTAALMATTRARHLVGSARSCTAQRPTHVIPDPALYHYRVSN